jgi:hypothetical protein
MGHLPKGVDASVGASGAAEVDEAEPSLANGMLQAAGDGADTLRGLPGPLLLPALETATVIFDQEAVRGDERGFLSHPWTQEPMTAFTASMRDEGS